MEKTKEELLAEELFRGEEAVFEDNAKFIKELINRSDAEGVSRESLSRWFAATYQLKTNLREAAIYKGLLFSFGAETEVLNALQKILKLAGDDDIEAFMDGCFRLLAKAPKLTDYGVDSCTEYIFHNSLVLAGFNLLIRFSVLKRIELFEQRTDESPSKGVGDVSEILQKAEKLFQNGENNSFREALKAVQTEEARNRGCERGGKNKALTPQKPQIIEATQYLESVSWRKFAKQAEDYLCWREGQGLKEIKSLSTAREHLKKAREAYEKTK